MTRWLHLLVLLALAQAIQGAEISLPGSPRLLLQAAGAAGSTEASPERALQQSAWLEAGLRCELLTRCHRLLPEGISAEQKERLAAALLAGGIDGENLLAKLVATFPDADSLIFDGEHYLGGNLRDIDSLLGVTGRPVAFDRARPALLVPLSPAAEKTLADQHTAFQADPKTKKLREDAARVFGPAVAATMFADGQFLRRYAGRFDDLYFHIFQHGDGSGALAFRALVSGLVGQDYEPLGGFQKAGSGPVAAFDLDDILTDGGKAAVAQFLKLQAPAGRFREPFQQFAFRVLPTMLARVPTTPAGSRFTATGPEIAHARQSRQSFYPPNVPPLYRSPDRFLSEAGRSSLFQRVANVTTASQSSGGDATDSWFPLPQTAAETAAQSRRTDATSSAQLFPSSGAHHLEWEDPQLNHVLSDPDQPAGASASDPLPDQDPRRRAADTRFIAVVTPTADEAAEYEAVIAASDEKLRDLEQTRGRLHLLRQALETALSATTATSLQQAIQTDLGQITGGESACASRIQSALQERAQIRAGVENQLQRDRVAPLQALSPDSAGSKPAPVDPKITL